MSKLKQFVLLFIGQLILTRVAQAEERKLLLYDFSSNQISQEQKQSILNEVRVLITNETKLRIIDETEVKSALVVQNPLKEKVQLLILSQQKRYKELQELLKEAKDDYRASNFVEARDLLQKIWKGLEVTPLVAEASFVVETLSYLGAVAFYLGDSVAQRAYFSSIWDLGVPSLFPKRNFPPNIGKVFDDQEVEERWRKTPLSFDSNATEIEAVFLGTKVPVVQVESRFKILLPLGQKQLADQPLHFRADGYAPLIYRMDELPAALKFQSLEDSSRQTQALFSPVFASSVPVALDELAKKMDANLILLGDMKTDFGGQWIGRFQWLDAQLGQSSGVIEILAKNEENFKRLLKLKLLSWLNAEGFIIGRDEFKSNAIESRSRASSPKLLNQWWFWGLVGLGAAAAGTGTYFLLNSGNSVKFVVEPAN